MTQPAGGYIEFDAAALPPEQRFPAWASAMPYHDVSTPDPEQFAAKVRAWFLPPIVVTDSRLSPVRWIRTAAHVRSDREESISLQFLVTGTCAGSAGGRPFIAGPGDIIVIDRARPMEVVGGSLHAITVSLPRTFLDEALPGADVHGVVLRDGMSGLLRAFLTALPDTLAAAETDAAEIARLLRDLVAAALRQAGHGEAEAGPHDAALGARVRRHVTRNLTGNLDVATLCAALGVSRSSLYRAFESEGGIAAYVQRRRLARLHRLLSDPAERRSVSELAALHGFPDKSHFSRLFRRTFGYGARSLRLRAPDKAQSPVPGEAPRIFNAWHEGRE